MSKLLQGQDLVAYLLINTFNGHATRQQLRAEILRLNPEDSLGRTLGRAISAMRRDLLATEDSKGLHMTASGYEYYRYRLDGKASKPEDYIESKVYDTKLRKYVVTLKA